MHACMHWQSTMLVKTNLQRIGKIFAIISHSLFRSAAEMIEVSWWRARAKKTRNNCRKCQDCPLRRRVCVCIFRCVYAQCPWIIYVCKHNIITLLALTACNCMAQRVRAYVWKWLHVHGPIYQESKQTRNEYLYKTINKLHTLNLNEKKKRTRETGWYVFCLFFFFFSFSLISFSWFLFSLSLSFSSSSSLLCSSSWHQRQPIHFVFPMKND